MQLLPPILRTLFQVPYAATPLFATLTKTAGMYTNNSHSGSPRLPRLCWGAHARGVLGIGFKFFLFTLLRTLLHGEKLNPFIFKRFRTLCEKHPGYGEGYTRDRGQMGRRRRGSRSGPGRKRRQFVAAGSGKQGSYHLLPLFKPQPPTSTTAVCQESRSGPYRCRKQRLWRKLR